MSKLSQWKVLVREREREIESLRAQLAEAERERDAMQRKTIILIERWLSMRERQKTHGASIIGHEMDAVEAEYPLPPTEEVKMEDLCPYHDLGDEFAKCPEDCEVDKS